MVSKVALHEATGRKYFHDEPDALAAGEEVTFILNLHGGGSHGIWQHQYFPAHEHSARYRLVVVTPTAATREPMRHWRAAADDDYLRDLVELVCARYGAERIRAFWLVGHSQGGMTANRLLRGAYFAERVDGWLSLSGGRIGAAAIPESFFPGGRRPRLPDADPDGPAPGRAVAPDSDFSFIFATGEHEIVQLPETSPWAEKYGAGPRERLPDVVDTEPGQVTGATAGGGEGWGREARPGTAEVYVYPGARDDRLIADVVRLDKGHTEGLEPRITEELIKMMLAAPGGKLQALWRATR